MATYKHVTEVVQNRCNVMYILSTRNNAPIIELIERGPLLFYIRTMPSSGGWVEVLVCFLCISLD